MGAQFKFLPLIWSIFDGFSKFLFLLKAGFNYQFVKKWVRNCEPCAPTSAGPAEHIKEIPLTIYDYFNINFSALGLF